MPYIKETCVAGKTIEVSKYHSQRWNCRGETRAVRENETSVQQEKINQRLASKNLRRLMNANFVDGDSYITLDFRKELRPASAKELQKIASDFWKGIKKEMADAGTLKYVYVKELGPKGAAHLHMVTNLRDVQLVRKCWPYGAIHLDPLNTDGQYADLAEYFIKYADKTMQTEGKLVGKRWQSSHNLDKPEVKKEVIGTADTWNHRTTVPRLDRPKRKEDGSLKEYYVEGDSVMEGVNGEGYGYFSYILHEIPDSPYLYRYRPDLMKGGG